MIFSSLVFVFLFLPAVLLGVFILPKIQVKNIFLILVSLLFYAWGEGTMVLLLLFSSLLNYLFGLLIGKTGYRRFFMITAVILNLLILVYYKYLGFLLGNLPFLVSAGKANLHIHLPIGISFFTFQGLSYIFDVFRNRQLAEKNPLKVILYISLFPQLLAGPIIKYHDISQQLSARRLSLEGSVEGIHRFIIGLAKKVLLANPLGLLAADILGNNFSLLDSSAAWISMVAFTLQIYFDFSGYSDMAIGIGRMLGFNYPENFNFPYISRSIKEFWSRWHMSLSTWLRDYLFLPLAYSISRRLKKDKYFGLRTDKWIYACASLITMFICGLWHGASWNFILWGSYFGFFLVLEQFFLGRWLKRIRYFSVLYVILVVVCGWAIFKTDSLPDAGQLLKKMFLISAPGRLNAGVFLNREYITILAAGLLFSVPWHQWIRVNNLRVKKIMNYAGVVFLLCLFLFSAMTLATNTYTPFIYFRF